MVTAKKALIDRQEPPTDTALLDDVRIKDNPEIVFHVKYKKILDATEDAIWFQFRTADNIFKIWLPKSQIKVIRINGIVSCKGWLLERALEAAQAKMDEEKQVELF